MSLVKGGFPKLRSRKLAKIVIDEFKGGSNLLFSETRLKKNEAAQAINLMLDEDGIWTKRWGSEQYGPDIGATIDGFTEYRKTDGTTELIVVAAGVVYRVDPDAGTKTAITGVTLTSGNQCFFLQLGDFLYIGNGTDALVKYNGTTLSQYTQIAAPAWAGTPLARAGGLAAGNYTYYYQVTAFNDIGETTANAEQSITVNEARDDWSSGDGITLDWDAVSGADGYTVYFTDTSGYEVKLTDVFGATTYTDLGTAIPNTYIEPPSANTTGGPKLKSMVSSGNRIWGTDPNYPYRVYFTGSGVYLGNFAPSYGGGWVDLETGGKYRVIAVTDYQGNAYALTESPDGKGTIWKVEISTAEIQGTKFTVPIPTKIIGSRGTQSPLSVVLVENDVMYFNKNEIGILGYEPNVLNVLRSNEISAKIRPYIRSLADDSIDNVCSFYHDGKVFFAAPSTSGVNDRIFLYDRERLAWCVYWTVGANQFGTFTDSDDKTRLLGSTGSTLIEFAENYEGDSGSPFQCIYTSPRLPVSDDWTEFYKIKRAYVKLRNTNGTINFSFKGTQKGQNITTLSSATITQEASNTGIGWDKIGTVKMGTSDGAPTVFTSESLIKYLVINKLLRDIRWEVSTAGTRMADRFDLIGLKAEGMPIATSKPADWKLS